MASSAGHAQAPGVKGFVLRQAMALWRQLVVATQVRPQAQQLHHVIDRAAQEMKIAAVRITLQWLYPFNVTFLLDGELFNAGVNAGAAETYQGFHIVLATRVHESM